MNDGSAYRCHTSRLSLRGLPRLHEVIANAARAVSKIATLRLISLPILTVRRAPLQSVIDDATADDRQQYLSLGDCVCINGKQIL